MLKLYSFHFSCGRMGSLEGLFVEDDKLLSETIGTELYFGEVLGKHSEVYGPFEESDVSVLSEDQDKIQWLVEVAGKGSKSISGYNPMDYIPEDEMVEE